MRLSRLLSGMLLWVWAATLWAQPLAFRRYDHRDGLPQSQINALLEDRSGFLWIGTLDSLARLGPSGFEVYPQVKMVPFLMQASNGSVWAASTEKGLFEIRGSQVKAYGPSEGLTVTEVFSVVETTTGDIYAATRLGIFKKKGSRFELVNLPGDWKNTAIFTLVGTPDGGLWMGSVRGRVALWRENQLQVLQGPEGVQRESVVFLRSDGQGGLWILTSAHLGRLQPGARTWKTVDLGKVRPTFMRTLEVSPNGELLVALGPDGLLLRRTDGQVQRLTAEQGLPPTAVNCALRDRRGVLWVGTDGEGLISQSATGLHSLELDLETGASLGLGAVTRFLELAPGKMLIGSSLGLFRWEAGKGITRRWRTKDGLPFNDVWALEQDGHGGVLVGTTKGLARLQGDRLTPFCKELALDRTHLVVRWKDRFWVSTDRGVAEVDSQGALKSLTPLPMEVGWPTISGLMPHDGSLLIGCNLGIYRMSYPDRKLVRAFPTSPVAKQAINTLASVPDGRIWVSTNNGLFEYRPLGGGQWTHYGEEEGLLSKLINWSQILPDGTLAVGHGQGVSLVRDASVTHLTRNLGLVSDETNQDSYLLDSQGRLWFGMIGGLCVLDTRILPEPKPIPPPTVLEAQWEGGSAWQPKSLNLPARHGTLILRFDTPFPSAPTPPRYQVWLEGLHQGWAAHPEGALSMPMAGLQAGHYTFRVRASLDGITWVEADRLPIVIAKAWYLTWAAWVLYVLASIGLVFSLFRWRTRALHRQNARLETKVRTRTEELALRSKSLERLHHQLKRNLESRVQLMNTVTHDLRSPLTSILLSVGRLRDSRGTYGNADSTLNVLEREALRLEGILKTMLDKSKSESLTDTMNQRVCHPSEILAGLTDTLRLKAESRGLESELSLDPDSDSVWVLADVTAMQQVLFNLVENALKFTPAPGRVGIRSRVDPQSYTFEVWDTGRGIPSEKLPTMFQPFIQAEAGDARTGWGLGLSICKSMVEAHLGRIEVESQVGWGSTFRVIIPLIRPHEESSELPLPDLG